MAREEFTPEQKNRVVRNIMNEYTALSLYEAGGFDNMELRTFYRRYRDVKAELGMLTKSKKMLWEGEDTRKLKQLAAAGVSIKDMSIDGRTVSATRTKCHRDGISTGQRKYKPWTEEEIRVLVSLRSQHMSARKIEETGLLQGRTVNDIYLKIHTMRKNGEL